MKIIEEWLSIGIFLIVVRVSNCDHLSGNFDAAEEALLTDSPSMPAPSMPTLSMPTPSRTSRAFENDPFPTPISLEDFEKLQKLEISSDFPTPKALPISGEVTEVVRFEIRNQKSDCKVSVYYYVSSKQPSFPSSTLTTMTTRRMMTTTEQTCPKHEKWYRCQPCDLCTQFFDTVCEKKCTPGCGCQRFYRRKNGQCIRVKECGFKKRSDLMTKKIEMTTEMTTIGDGKRMKSLPPLISPMKKLVENQKNFVRMSNMERGNEIQHTTPMPRTKIFEIQHPNLTTQKPHSPITTKIIIPLKTLEIPKNRLTVAKSRQIFRKKLDHLNRYFIEKTEGQIRFLLKKAKDLIRNNGNEIEKNTINKREKLPKGDKSRHDGAVMGKVMLKEEKKGNLEGKLMKRRITSTTTMRPRRFSTMRRTIATMTTKSPRMTRKLFTTTAKAKATTKFSATHRILPSTTIRPRIPGKFSNVQRVFPIRRPVNKAVKNAKIVEKNHFPTHPVMKTIEESKKSPKNSLNPGSFHRRTRVFTRTRKLILRRD